MKESATVMAVPAGEQLLTASDVAARLSVSIRTVWRLRGAKLLPAAVRLTGNMLRWREADVDEFIRSGASRSESHQQASTPGEASS